MSSCIILTIYAKSALQLLSYRSITYHKRASGTVIQQHPIVIHISPESESKKITVILAESDGLMTSRWLAKPTSIVCPGEGWQSNLFQLSMLQMDGSTETVQKARLSHCRSLKECVQMLDFQK